MMTLPAILCAMSFLAAQIATDRNLAGQLDAIHREYLSRPDVGGLVALDGRIRQLLEEPWKRARRSADRKNYRPAWSAIGINIGKYSDALEYSGKLLVEAHRVNPVSKFRQFTLFAPIMGERPSHGLGEMPDVKVARQYLKEFPDGPFARDVAIILGDFYNDLFKVIRLLRQKQPRDYKYDCFEKYLDKTSLDAQAAKTRQRSMSYYDQALAHAPPGWAETADVRDRLSEIRSGRSNRWYYCAD